MLKKSSKPPKINEADYIKVEADEKWLHTKVGNDFNDLDLFRIVDFFVLHSPCKVSSYSPRTLESLGWSNPWRSSKFRFAFDEIAGLNEGTTFFYHDSKNHLLGLWNMFGKEFFEVNGEYAVIIHAGESNPRMDLLHHIRNSFAHGRFAVKRNHGEYYIFFEDVGTISGLSGIYVTARMCFKKSTLLQWADFFEIKTDKAKELGSLHIVS